MPVDVSLHERVFQLIWTAAVAHSPCAVQIAVSVDVEPEQTARNEKSLNEWVSFQIAPHPASIASVT